MYGKVFTSMYDGTLATRGPWQALVTFQQFIVLSDKHGVVDMTAEAISRRTTIPLEIIQAGIDALEQPDEQSRTPDLDGRRIARLSDSRAWGWQIVNYVHYRNMRSAEERRDYMRKYQREYRAKQKTVNQNVNSVSEVNQSSKQYAEAEALKSKALFGKPNADPQKREKQTPKPSHQVEAEEVLEFLNSKARRSFRPVRANIDPILTRFKEGYSVQDCKSVIAKKVREWRKDDKMAPYLRPKTIFNRTNFANYAGELVDQEERDGLS